MIITDLDLTGAAYLREKHDGSFPFPDINDPLFVVKKLVISDGEIIGAGLLRITSEGILILDKDTNLFSRTMATRALVRELDCAIKRSKLTDCHAFVHDRQVMRLLRRFGFEISVSGTPLVYHGS